MRVGASVLLLNGFCYQSYGWDVLRPLGALQTALDALEGYGCDEISIIRPVRSKDDCLCTDLKLLAEIQSMTPISFGGGIRTLSDLEALMPLPLERLILSSAFIQSDREVLSWAVVHLGRQAIQCLLPFKNVEGRYLIFNSCTSRYVPLEEIDWAFIEEYANEVILHDASNEGFGCKFSFGVLDFIPFEFSKVVVSGGTGPESCKTALKLGLASVLVENRFLHAEYPLGRYRDVD